MTTPALTAAGLVTWRTADVRESIASEIRDSAAFGDDPQTGADTVVGQLIDCPAPQLGALWELLQALWDEFDIDNAEGVYLENLCRLAGLRRMAATFGTVTLTLSGTPATVVPAGSRSRVPGGLIFALDEDATIAGGGTVDATATATETGDRPALAGTVTEIVDAVAGLTGVTNAADAQAGTDVETDAELHLRREQTISGVGSCTDQAAKAALDALADVTASVVLSNRTDATDSRGIYARTRMCVVYPATVAGAGVARAIWDHLGGGLSTQGAESATITDAQGYQQVVRWEHAADVDIWWEVDVTTNSDYPTGGDALVAAAVLAYGNSLGVGDDVLPIGAVNRIHDDVPGVTHLVVRVGKAAVPAGTVPVSIDLVEVSAHDSTRILVA